MPEAGSRETTCPPEILALIPWYPDGTLSSTERGAVEAHAAGCAACREEIRALGGTFDPPGDVEVPPAARVLARVLERIDAYEAAGRPGVRPAPPIAMPRPSAAARRSAWTTRPLALAATLALALAVGALAVISFPQLFGVEPYRTAAMAEETRASGPIVEIIPRDEVSAAELGAALRAVQGELVAGPMGTLGRYRVRLPDGADAAAAAAKLRAKDGGIASYAEPLPL